MGLTLPTPLTIDSLRNHPAHQPLRPPNLPRPHQPATPTSRPLRKRMCRNHHLPRNPRKNQERLPITHPSQPLPHLTRHQHLPSLLLPQRHIRLPNPRSGNTSTSPTPILHRNNPPSNSHHLQSPPHPRTPTRYCLASSNQGSTQDPTKPHHHNNHHHPRPDPPPGNQRLPTIHTRIQPHQPRKRSNTHPHEPSQHNPTPNPPIRTHRTLHQSRLDHRHSRPLHRNPRNSLDEST